MEVDDIQVDEYAFGEDDKVNLEECILFVPMGTEGMYRHHPVFGQFKMIQTEKQI